MLEDITAPEFAKLVGERFALILDDRSILDLEPVSVTPGHPRAGKDEPRRGPFSIIFKGPLEPILPQQIYRLENRDLGAMELFIVPIGPDKSAMQYEAVFG